MPLISRITKPVSGAKHIGRKNHRYSFTVSEIVIAGGLPNNLGATGLVVQMSRGPKLTSTKEVDYNSMTNTGSVAFPSTLSFIATLFDSKAGKATGFSDKRYRISVLASKPQFGSSKRSLKEIASADLNISNHATSEQPTPLSLSLDRRLHDGLPVTLELKISARPVKAGAGDDDDDDAQSEVSSFTAGGFDAGRDVDRDTEGTPSNREQDLTGFDTATPGAGGGDPYAVMAQGQSAAAAAREIFRARKASEQRIAAAPATGGASPAPSPAGRKSSSALNPFGSTTSPKSSNPFGSTPKLATPPSAAAAAPAPPPHNPFADGSSPASASMAAIDNPFDDDEEEEEAEQALSEEEDDDEEESGALSDSNSVEREFGGSNSSGKPTPNASQMATPRQQQAPPWQSAAIAGGAASNAASSNNNRADLDELVKTKEELQFVKEQLARAQAQVEEVRADGRRRSGEAEKGWTGAQREVSRLRSNLSLVETERDGLRQQLQEADKARLGAGGLGSDAAEEVAAARAAATKAQGEAAAAQTRAKALDDELEGLRGQLAAQAEGKTAIDSQRDDETAELSMLLVEAKMAAAQYAFERDEAKQKCKALRDELADVVGGGKKVAQKATKLEVKYEELRQKYDNDMNKMIELRLQLAEYKAKLAEHEAPQVV